MCGVAAVYAYHYAASRVDRAELVSIRDRMSTRGPDGAGEWLSEDERVGLVHRRLSIIDLSDAAAQPMPSPSGEVRISFNGEIYNFRALRGELEAKGVRFRTGSDTEVLLALYEQCGTRMFARLRGMYAFALWDSRKRALLLARDPYGIKPLYFADDGWTVRVASQVKALLADPRVSRAPELAGHVGFCLFGSVPEPWTLYQEIRAVPAGSFQWIDEAGVGEPQTHTDLADLFTARDGSEVSVNTVREALADSVRAHLVSDVPVGVFLSAGIDSAALASCMVRGSIEHPVAITIGFDEFRGTPNDEVPLASRVAESLELRHVVRRVTEAEFQGDLPLILAAMDQPSIDGINSWFAAKAAKEQGLKVVLSGLGADELLGGYDSFVDIPRWMRATAWARLIPGLGKAARMAAAPLLELFGVSAKAAGMIELGGTYAGAYLLRRGLFMPWELGRMLPAEATREGLRRLRWSRHLGAQASEMRLDARTRVALLESRLYMRNQLLRDCDWASMAHGVEVRTPYVDVEMARRLGSIVATLPAGAGKRLLAAATELPDEVAARRKSGFGTPIPDWLENAPRLSQSSQGPTAGQHWSRRLAPAMLAEALR